jgi:hypothetical protein
LVSADFGSAAYAALKPKQMVNKETIRIVLVITFSKKYLNLTLATPVYAENPTQTDL